MNTIRQTAELMLPNNTYEENAKVKEMLIPVLEYLTQLNPDQAKVGFFTEEGESVFKSATIEIKIIHRDSGKKTEK